MAITYVQTVTPWSGNTTAVSGSFTPGEGDCILVAGADEFNYPQVLTITGTSGSYSVLTPPGTFDSDYGATWQLAYQNSATAVLQTITVVTNGVGDLTIGLAIDYSGVGSVLGYENSSAQPGTGAGAVVGVSVLVPTGSVLVAIALDEDNNSPALTNTAGTSRSSGTVAANAFAYNIVEYTGAGANIQPAFTSTGGATNYYMVVQFLLSPPSDVLLGQALT